MEVRCGDVRMVFDLGSGLRELGESILAEKSPVEVHLFLSHYHYDHVQGIPFFTPLFIPLNRFTFRGPRAGVQNVKAVMEGQMVQPYFPIPASFFRAQLRFEDAIPGVEMKLGEATVRAVNLNHPGGCIGYRVEYRGRSVVYFTDVELHPTIDPQAIAFAEGADLFICDAMYTRDEYEGRGGAPKVGWGHSTWEAAVDAAEAAGVKTFVVFHHDPTRTDDALDSFLGAVRARRPEAVAATEGMYLEP
ncbi:MAG: MBL fold metallo-hydrolase [Deltaproteobacteria bacterium]|nr:MBL fold metallo-hydrolase [Deltaproteobacteria bacterium]